MQIINYFESENQNHWLGEIKKSDWRAALYLCELIQKNELEKYCGDGVKILLLTEGDALLSFCTYSKYDEVADRSISPWVGFVYTFPQHRGKRLIGKLIEHAYSLAKADGYKTLYISTGEVGLYEKYGFTFWKTMKDVNGEETRVYKKEIA